VLGVYLTVQSSSWAELMAMTLAFVVHWDSVCVDVAIDYLSIAEHFEFAELEALRVTSLVSVTFADGDVVTFVVVDSFVVRVVEMEPYTEDYFHAFVVVVAVEWQVLVSSWANMLVLEVEPLVNHSID
jgi:hypothetical protein